MSVAGRAKAILNAGLRRFDMRIESLAAERAEHSRLQLLEDSGQFIREVFPVLPSFASCNAAPLLESVRRYADSAAAFDTKGDPSGFRMSNEYFSSPDAEVAYSLVREFRPGRIVEIGSGNSTCLFRAAIRDGGLATELVAIDPSPRREVTGVADRVFEMRLQDLDENELLDMLGPGDVLFIDSSHKVESGSDVVVLLLRLLPALRRGVLVHLHDIFLPFEYPREWLVDLGWGWNEQYLVQALLQDSQTYDVLWPGYYLQRTLPGFREHFHSEVPGRGSSLWLRKSS